MKRTPQITANNKKASLSIFAKKDVHFQHSGKMALDHHQHSEKLRTPQMKSQQRAYHDECLCFEGNVTCVAGTLLAA